MNDVFDEDLMKELGLDPDEIEAVKGKIPEPKKAPPAPAPQPSTVARATVSPPRDKSETAPAVPPKSPAQAPSPAPKKNVLPDLPETDMRQYGDKMAGEVPVHLAAVLGKKTISLKDVIELKVGEVIDLKKQPQDLIDLVANGKLVAKAELVLVDGRVGTRIVKLIK